ncbi:hypothetical protein WDZ92_48675, partial [Nostoc sp. NIES-2111]
GKWSSRRDVGLTARGRSAGSCGQAGLAAREAGGGAGKCLDGGAGGNATDAWAGEREDEVAELLGFLVPAVPARDGGVEGGSGAICGGGFGGGGGECGRGPDEEAGCAIWVAAAERAGGGGVEFVAPAFV